MEIQEEWVGVSLARVGRLAFGVARYNRSSSKYV